MKKTNDIDLNTLRDEVYQDAVAHGLWDWDCVPTDCAELICDEASELDSAAMDWEDDVYNDNSSFCDGLADVIIMCLSVAGKLGIDIDKAVQRKMAINKARPWKHGKGGMSMINMERLKRLLARNLLTAISMAMKGLAFISAISAVMMLYLVMLGEFAFMHVFAMTGIAGAFLVPAALAESVRDAVNI